MGSATSLSEEAPPWPPTTHELLAIKIACRQLGVRAAVDDIKVRILTDDIKDAPPIPAPAAQDSRYVAFTEYIVDRHCWMDPWVDFWLVDYWWAWGLLDGNLAAPNAYVEPNSASVAGRSKAGSNCPGPGRWI